MRNLTKLTIVLAVIVASSFSTVASASNPHGPATQPVQAQQAGPTITITDFTNEPADLAVKVNETITITNNDGFPHTVTADDGTFDLDVPAKGSVTLTIPKAGAFPYTCKYHPGQHNPASITVS